jgi:hypothetical protein
MGKINKHSNLYNKDGELIREAPLKDYTIQELEELIDSMKPGKARDTATWMLFDLYNKYGNPHEEDLIKRIKETAKVDTDESEIRRALDELRNVIQTNEAAETRGEKEETSENVQQEEVQGYDVNSMDTEDVEPITEEENDDTRKS